jgi:hypothetical protein
MTEPTTAYLVVVDADDPTLPDYQADDLPLWILAERVGYTASLNACAQEHWDRYAILGAFGDDVLFRTRRWDRVVQETLTTPGIAYANDLIHGQNHPSAVFMSSVIAKALGWLALPATRHQWADDGWKRLGQATERLRYMPSVTIEHMHPAVGKAEMDEGYRAVFDGENAKRDHAGFTAWAEGGLEADAAKVRAVL